MYVVIAGGGMMGTSLAQNMISRHNVVVIDSDAAQCERIFKQVGAVAVKGTATSINTLLEAGIKKADVAVGMMRNDADNLAFCLLAKSYGVKRVMVRMRDQNFLEVYKRAGADNIVYEVDKLVSNFVNIIEQPLVKGIIDIGYNQMKVIVLTVPEGAKAAGKTIIEITSDAAFPGQCNFISLYHDPLRGMDLARGNSIVPGGGDVVLAVTQDVVDDVVKFLTSK